MCIVPSMDFVKVTSAGCVFTARSAGTVYVLLGRERIIDGWSDGSNRWSAFSGKVIPGEDSESCAAREAFEESLGLPFGAENTHDRAKRLISDRTIGRVEFSVQGSACICKNVLNVVRIDYDCNLPYKFGYIRSRLEHINRTRRVYTRNKKLHGSAPDICIPGAKLSERVTVVKSRIIHPTCCDVRLVDVETLQNINVTLVLDQKQFNDVSMVLDAHREFVDGLSRSPKDILKHPAVYKTEINSEVVDVCVSQSFMEKSEVRWWNIEDLKIAIRNENAKDFRPHFFHLLPQIIQVCE
jgi:hypothetical protein